MTNLPGSGLYAITQARNPDIKGLARDVNAALRGGARVIQFRDKTKDHAWRLEAATLLKSICADFAAPLIINDDGRLALESGADGVHLGRDDNALDSARELAGEGIIIGISCYNDLHLAEAAAEAGVTYLAFGSVYPSTSKPGAVHCPLEVIMAAKKLGLPLVAIGGLSLENGAAVIAAGADYLAVISAVFAAHDVRVAAAGFTALWPK